MAADIATRRAALFGPSVSDEMLLRRAKLFGVPSSASAQSSATPGVMKDLENALADLAALRAKNDELTQRLLAQPVQIQQEPGVALTPEQARQNVKEFWLANPKGVEFVVAERDLNGKAFRVIARPAQ